MANEGTGEEQLFRMSTVRAAEVPGEKDQELRWDKKQAQKRAGPRMSDPMLASDRPTLTHSAPYSGHWATTPHHSFMSPEVPAPELEVFTVDIS
jgi:hypothetical protein